MCSYWKALDRSVKMHHEGIEWENAHSLHWLTHYFRAIKVKPAWNSTRHFVCISACLNACLNACVCVIMHVCVWLCMSVHSCGHMCAQDTACVQQDTWVALAKLKGVNYPALFFAWGLILSLYKAEASETTVTNCSLSFIQMGSKSLCEGGV